MIWYVQSYRLLLHNFEKRKTKRAQTARLYKIDGLDSEADEGAGIDRKKENNCRIFPSVLKWFPV
jgi:hypothetical protein